MNSPVDRNPFAVLGLSPDAGEEEVRARYLELIKQFPPERDPDRFREIRVAYEMASDPLLIAEHLVLPPDDVKIEWTDTIDEQAARPPALTPEFIFSLGNRETHAKQATSQGND